MNPPLPAEQMKIYGQMTNTCGLASLLMNLQPETHGGIAEFLTRWWAGVKDLIKAPEAELMEWNWERVLNYILLKVLRHPRLRAYADEKLGDIGVEYFILFEDRIQQGFRRICIREGPRGMFLKNAFENSGAVCDPLLQGHLNLMKLDSELKILYRFFGGDFEHHYEAEEPTGAIKFTRKEITEGDKKFLTKVKILEDAVQAKKRIFLGLGHHWMAVKGIKSFEDEMPAQDRGKTPKRNYFMYVLDPEVKQEKTLPFPRMDENHLFYIFKTDGADLKAGLALLDEVLKEDLPKDAEVFRRFQANEGGDEAVLKQDLAEFLGAWPALEEGLEKEEEEEAEGQEAGVGEGGQIEALGERGEATADKPLPSESEMVKRIRMAIKKAFSDYSKI